jgi:hypothetical protein
VRTPPVRSRKASEAVTLMQRMKREGEARSHGTMVGTARADTGNGLGAAAALSDGRHRYAGRLGRPEPQG